MSFNQTDDNQNELFHVLLGSPFIALCVAKGPRHSFSAAYADFPSLTLHNAQARNCLICSSRKILRCNARNPPNVPLTSICLEYNSDG